MKKFLLFSLFILVVSCSGDGGNDESSDPGNLYISTQEEVDNFNFTTVPGTLYIESTLIHNLLGLSGLTKAGSISIINTQIISLEGLQNLQNLTIGGVFLRDNPFLESVSSLSNIGAQIYDLTILRCESLSDLTGLNINENAQKLEISFAPIENLNAFSNIKIIEKLWLTDLPSLNSVEGIINLEIISTGFQLRNLMSLSSLEGFNNLISFPRLSISNVGIENFQGFNGVTSVYEMLNIHSLNSLQSLSGFDNLEIIHGGLLITSCVNLVDFGSFQNLTTIDGGGLLVKDLPSLESIIGLSNLASAGSLTIDNCNNLLSLEGLNNLSTINSGITLKDLNNLQSISALNNVAGNFSGNFNLMNLSSLSSLEGLNNINQVGELNLINLSSINSLDGLNGITSIKYLTIDNSSIDNLNGLNNLTNAHGFNLYNCSLIQNLNGTNLIEDAEASNSNPTSMRIDNNPLLSDFCGLTDYANGTPYLTVDISDNAYNPTLEQIRSAIECNQ